MCLCHYLLERLYVSIGAGHWLGLDWHFQVCSRQIFLKNQFQMQLWAAVPLSEPNNTKLPHQVLAVTIGNCPKIKVEMIKHM
jgi:hypothetical protein